MNDKWIKRWTVASESGPGVYIVALDKDGTYGCSCPVWKFHRKQCKHIQEVLAGRAPTLEDSVLSRLVGNPQETMYKRQVLPGSVTGPASLKRWAQKGGK